MAKPLVTVWVLTRVHNDHDQHGEYFEQVFATKPDAYMLVDYIKGYHTMPSELVKAALHLAERGGGRIGNEDVWFFLHAVQPK